MLSPKHQVFVDEYLICWNSSEAARRAGYKGRSNVIGSRLVARPDIKAAIEVGLKNKSILDLPISKSIPDKVYFIQAENGLVKIGIASNVESRLCGLNTASPVELVLLFFIEDAEARKLEKSFHNIFKNKRVKGEWFRLVDLDIAWIKSNYDTKC